MVYKGCKITVLVHFSRLWCSVDDQIKEIEISLTQGSPLNHVADGGIRWLSLCYRWFPQGRKLRLLDTSSHLLQLNYQIGFRFFWDILEEVDIDHTPKLNGKNILRLPILCHDSGNRVGNSAQKWNFLSAVFLNTCSRKARHLYGSGYLLNLLICELCVGFVSRVEGMSNSTLFFNGKANCSIL